MFSFINIQLFFIFPLCIERAPPTLVKGLILVLLWTVLHFLRKLLLSKLVISCTSFSGSFIFFIIFSLWLILLGINLYICYCLLLFDYRPSNLLVFISCANHVPTFTSLFCYRSCSLLPILWSQWTATIVGFITFRSFLIEVVSMYAFYFIFLLVFDIVFILHLNYYSSNWLFKFWYCSRRLIISSIRIFLICDLFYQIHYDRIGEDGLFSHKEITVIFVPDLSECLPSLDTWRSQWLAQTKNVRGESDNLLQRIRLSLNLFCY